MKLRSLAEKMREEEMSRLAAAEKFDIGKENEFSGSEDTHKPIQRKKNHCFVLKICVFN